jgi:hypothetical protein
MSAQVTITQLPAAGAITGAESVPIVQNGVTVQTTTAAIAGSPTQTYTYLTVSQTPQLANSRYFGATNGLSITDGGAQGLFNITTTGALLSLVNSGTGFQVKTSSTAITSRSVATSGAGVTVANGSGVAGDPTISLTGQVLNLANLSANGLLTITTAGALSATAITNVANQTSVTNGDGIAGAPTVGLASNPIIPGTGGTILPVGTTGQRGSSTDGNLRYNTTTASFEGYANGAWGSIVTGSGVNSISFGTTGLTPSTSTTGSVTVAGTLVVANGGTGSTATPVAGSVIYGDGTNYAVSLAGNQGEVLTSMGTGTPVWSGIQGGTF